MIEQIPWLNEIVEAMKFFGGRASLSDIYIKIEESGRIDINRYTDWKAQIRKHIYLYSSDTEVFKGDPGDRSDLFYATKGKRKGYWGLRGFEPSDNNVELTEDDLGFVEGKIKLRQHICRERNPKVIQRAKEKFKQEHNGRLYCEICGFDFYKTYGELGEDFIEGHHTLPVSQLKQGQVTKIEDIALVCSNCHRMLHRRRPWLSKEKLNELLNTKREF
ncbi:HNH endonuclease [Sporolactobacillus kofuensis]|uniref:HNH endonuclease n=1 Tax=Sporolactobacillus kofuensis TaxID=269672 RepID=A0ABW1WG28_9BACL|nr:HNH endonuclease [Sporolactobacillus kofuensis]MCO7176975.1 HNH endonuclease [Sporolactobacillus kofuensis]